VPPKQPTPEYNFAAHYPHLLDEWDYEKNPKQPDQYTPMSGQRVWWICRKCGHNHQTQICNKSRPSNTNCKNCLGKVPHSDGHNSLAALRPDLAEDWYDERSPDEFQIGSHYRARWKCKDCSHIWRTQISKRAVLNRRCLSCTGQQAHSSGRDSVKALHPELIKEWNDEKDPSKYLPGSKTKIIWKCSDCNHEWPMTIQQRALLDQNCNFCNGPGGKHARVVHTDGRNSMRRTHPKLAKEFHPTKNGKFSPDNLIAGTNEKLWWICSNRCQYLLDRDCQNVWKNSGLHRVHDEQNCPTCGGGQNPLHSDGRNSLSNLRPELMEEWDFEKNVDFTPDTVTVSVGDKAHWICKKCGHPWSAIIASRSKGHGCPKCKKKTQGKLFDIINKLLFPENEVLWDYNHPDLRFEKTNVMMELDIWIPELNVAMEYQGEQHYEPKPHWGGEDAFSKLIDRDKQKKEACEKEGITLIEVHYSWEGDVESIKRLLIENGISLTE
jgi:rubrerythrin